MKMEWKDAEEIRQCLSTCGCSQEEIRRYIQVVEHGTKADQLCWLKRQRRMLMDQVHEAQRNVDCIDYLIKDTEL